MAFEKWNDEVKETIDSFSPIAAPCKVDNGNNKN